MKKSVLIFLLLLVLGGVFIFSCGQRVHSPGKKNSETLLKQIDSFRLLAFDFQAKTEAGAPQQQLQELFLRLRLGYKKIEWAVEYFEPGAAVSVNGPPVQDLEPSGQLIDPSGLQVIETFLFPGYDSANRKEIIRQTGNLIQASDKFSRRFSHMEWSDWQVFDAAKLEVFRMETLGITGFDNPLTLKSMSESGAILNSIGNALSDYIPKKDNNGLLNYINDAVVYLRRHPDFRTFNRMEFICRFANKVSAGITELEKKSLVQAYTYNRLLNQDAATLFDSSAFNVNAYAPDHAAFVTPEKIKLGGLLFSDPLLSGNGKRSCQSCHQPEKLFSDGLVKNRMINSRDLLSRNTPTLINAALQSALFYDLRVSTLEDQSHTVVQSKNEMHGSLELSVKRLWDDKKYRSLFLAAFPYEDKSRIDTFEVMNAIGSYIRSLVMLNGRFDDYMRGNDTRMNAREINGFNLFMGKAKCATCHYMPLFNGNFPPRFNKMEVEVIGVPKSIAENEPDGDLGRYLIVPLESFKYAFKIPTLRNAARTGPYMHNGVFASLDQVLDFYNRGGGNGFGFKLKNQTLPADKLDLSPQEMEDIIAFIKTLDSKS